ncbi:hypothetical protein CANCADRAFT_93555 [Tortispora caseinolytica NRRL Y-17796]|uniref:Uncharacterized protein n=1 Tax=Tortispora caseinolytica NRRL Y-17796 TaxID=767744 RepID=A0A1E4TMC1_9ASCO|nr:hypothetical protein CANCADRAFT_93555 [Tortispora caseinolytica NRRL Y-17796]
MTESCTNCHLPITTHQSLLHLHGPRLSALLKKDAGADVVDVALPEDRAALYESAASAHIVNRIEALDNTDSFVLLDTDDAEQQLANGIESTAELYNMLSGDSDMDFPMCAECTESVIAALKDQFENLTKERDVYIQQIRRLERPSSSEKVSNEEEAYRAALQEQTDLMKRLRDLETHHDSLKQQLAELDKEHEAIKSESTKFWLEQNKLAAEIDQFMNERESMNLIYDHDSDQLNKLRKTNVYNDTFCIGHDGFFGTINGLRLGRLPDILVEWPEINAALGYIVLLYANVLEILNISLPNYRLIPMGSTSRIEVLDSHHRPTKVLNVFSSGEYTIERVLTFRKFDEAMVALLSILKYIYKELLKRDANLSIPYKIDREYINGLSIKLSVNSSNGEWTTACKYLLTDSKWVLAYSSSTAGAAFANNDTS